MIKLFSDEHRIFRRFIFIAMLFSFFSSMGLHTAVADSSSINFFVTPNPLSVKIKKMEPIDRHHYRSRHRRYRLPAVVTNNGGSAIRGLRVRLILPPGLKVKNNLKILAVLPGKRSRKLTWMLRASKKGDYLVQIEAVGVIIGSGQLVRATAVQNISLDHDYEDGHEGRFRMRRWLLFPSYRDFFGFIFFRWL